jgi:hypothetical protein
MVSLTSTKVPRARRVLVRVLLVILVTTMVLRL